LEGASIRGFYKRGLGLEEVKGVKEIEGVEGLKGFFSGSFRILVPSFSIYFPLFGKRLIYPSSPPGGEVWRER
jgi:hypothetical protein